MRIAICTRLRIPIFICSRANSSSFASCGMRQLCADAEDVALVWQNEHRHAVKTTKSGHRRSSTHGGKENLWSPIMIRLFEVLPSNKHFSAPLIWSVAFFFPFFVEVSLSVDTDTHSSDTLTSTRVKCHWGTYWGVDGRRFFPEVQPSMRKKTYSTGREKSAGSGGVTHTSRCLTVAHKSTTGQRFVADHGFLPYPPLTFIKILTPIVFLLFFFFPPKKLTTIR